MSGKRAVSQESTVDMIWFEDGRFNEFGACSRGFDDCKCFSRLKPLTRVRIDGKDREMARGSLSEPHQLQEGKGQVQVCIVSVKGPKK